MVISLLFGVVNVGSVVFEHRLMGIDGPSLSLSNPDLVPIWSNIVPRLAPIKGLIGSNGGAG